MDKSIPDTAYTARLRGIAPRTEQLCVRIGQPSEFPSDATELALPDVASAAVLVAQHRPEVVALLQERQSQLLEQFGADAEARLAKMRGAMLLGLARMGVRHGSWGEDFHAYHNENHALELFDGRLGRLMACAGLGALELDDWIALSLFCCCHDLRQREAVDFSDPVGRNEAASIAETWRILELAGFDAVADRGLFVALQLMIAGSTFDARPAPPNPAEAVSTSGPLAPRLEALLDEREPGWRADAAAVDGVRLAQLASDLDTANVGEPLVWLAESASRLCQEREMRSGRTLDSAESAMPCLSFLSNGQERYFFELHRFCSDLGRATFEAVKTRNGPAVRELAERLRVRFADKAPGSGLEVLRAFSDQALALMEQGHA
mgnify:CR=1 FL=1